MIEVRDEQPKKALLPIEVTLSGIEIIFALEPSKPISIIPVTVRPLYVDGITIFESNLEVPCAT